MSSSEDSDSETESSVGPFLRSYNNHIPDVPLPIQPDRQTDRYFIDRKKVNPDLFVIEIEICTCIYNIVNLLKSYDNIHSMTYITKIMLTGIAIRNTGYILKIRLKGIARVT